MAADIKKKPLKSEEILKISANIFGGVILISLLLFLIVIIWGKQLSEVFPILKELGLYNERGGIYVDCSNPDNENSSFCKRDADTSAKSWNSLQKSGGGGGQFTLHDRDF